MLRWVVFPMLLLACGHPPAVATETPKPARARGSFELKVSPVPPDVGTDPPFGKVSIERQFRGDLEGASEGIMLYSGKPKGGPAGYVALERFAGTLHGRRGSFVLQHRGSMSAGAMESDIKVVPGSGTDDLVGLSGRMTIHIVGKNHSYELDYALTEPRPLAPVSLAGTPAR